MNLIEPLTADLPVFLELTQSLKNKPCIIPMLLFTYSRSVSMKRVFEQYLLKVGAFCFVNVMINHKPEQIKVSSVYKQIIINKQTNYINLFTL